MSTQANQGGNVILHGALAPSILSNFSGYAVFPVTVDAADPTMTGGAAAMISMDTQGRVRVVLSGSPGSTVGTIVASSIQVDATGNTGRAVAPLAGAAIVTLAAPPAGTYDIQVLAHYDAGAPAAAEINNMEFREGAAVVSVLSVLAVANIYSPVRVFRRVLDGATALSVNAVAAGTAGVGYNAQIIAIRVA